MKHSTISQCLAAGLLALGCIQARAEKLTLTATATPLTQPLIAGWLELFGETEDWSVDLKILSDAEGFEGTSLLISDFHIGDKLPASESSLEPDILVFPCAASAAVPIFNLKGVESGELVLDMPTLARIYRGWAWNWDDPDILTINGGLSLGTDSIRVFYNSESGAGLLVLLKLMESYANEAGIDWSDFGACQPMIFATPCTGDAAVQKAVSATAGAIGLVSLKYWQAEQPPYAALKVPDNGIVHPPVRSSSIKVGETTTTAETTWPLRLTHYITVSAQQDNENRARALLTLFDQFLANGSEVAAKAGFIPLNAEEAARVRADLQLQITVLGSPILPLEPSATPKTSK